MASPSAGFNGYAKVGPSANPTNKVSGLTDIAAPFTRAQYDVTNMDAGTTNGWQQFIPGLGGGKITLKANYDPSDTNGQVVLQNAWLNGTLEYFILSLNGTNTASFTGYVDAFQPHAPVNNKNDVTFTVTITGNITLT